MARHLLTDRRSALEADYQSSATALQETVENRH
jgi:hypothetical protein